MFLKYRRIYFNKWGKNTKRYRENTRNAAR